MKSNNNLLVPTYCNVGTCIGIHFQLHVYSPESTDSTESRVDDDEYRVKEIISGLFAGTIVVPSGPVHSMLTVTGIATVDFSSTVQVKIKEDPDRMELGDSE